MKTLCKIQRALLMAAVASCLQAGSASAEGLQIGASSNDVITELGLPQGVICYGLTNVMIYDQGTVSFSGGQVTAFEILSHEEYLKKKEKMRLQEEQWARQAEENRKQRLIAGPAEHSAKTGDPSFARLPAEDRLAFWEDFQLRFPEEPVAAEISACRKETNAVATAKQDTELDGIKLQADELVKQIDACRKTLYAPDRSSSRSERRHAQYQLRQLIPAVNALKAKLGEPPMVLDPTPPDDPDTSTISTNSPPAASEAPAPSSPE